MILRRLHELAEREGLTDPAFRTTSVPCLINIGPNGEYLGLKDIRDVEKTSATSKDGQMKTRRGKGREMRVPSRPVISMDKPPYWKTTDPAAIGKERPAVFLADSLPRVLPILRLIPDGERDKYDAQRSTFWRFIDFVAGQTEDKALQAMLKFQQWFANDADAQHRLCNDVEKEQFTLGSICTFTWNPDIGKTVLERTTLIDWWKHFYQQDMAHRAKGQRRGFCQVLQSIAPITGSMKSKVKGLMGIGCRADAYLVSSVPASTSYGLDGASCAMISDRAVDSYTQALNALIANRLPDRPKTSLRLTNCIFIFWTRNPAREFDPVNLFEKSEPEEIRKLLDGVRAGQSVPTVDPEQFYCLMLSGNAARIIVRNYIETTIPTVQKNLAKWFNDLRIFDPYANECTSAFPLRKLAAATVLDMKDLPPHIPSQLLSAAIQNKPLPDSILAACIHRLHAEGARGFRPARMALIKLVLNRSHFKENPMNQEIDLNRKDPAYICGRLLAVFERIQRAALGGEVNATIIDRFYGTASTAPALIFPRLFKSAEHHLSKVHGEKPGMAVNLQKELEIISADLDRFPRMLSLAEQGQFALGFYHQRANYRKQPVNQKNNDAEGTGND